jgi:hypothetical protein
VSPHPLDNAALVIDGMTTEFKTDEVKTPGSEEVKWT